MKNKILKFIVSIDVIILAISMCCLDSDSSIPFFVMILSMGFLGLFAYANNFFTSIRKVK